MQPMIVDKPVYDRPEYTPSDYDAPSYRLASRAETDHRLPLYTLPTDNKPSYEFRYEQAPAYMAPTR